jgi:hypothetical protein
LSIQQLGATSHSKSMQFNESSIILISDDSFRLNDRKLVKISDRNQVEREVMKLLQANPVVEAWEV